MLILDYWSLTCNVVTYSIMLCILIVWVSFEQFLDISADVSQRLMAGAVCCSRMKRPRKERFWGQSRSWLVFIGTCLHVTTPTWPSSGRSRRRSAPRRTPRPAPLPSASSPWWRWSASATDLWSLSVMMRMMRVTMRRSAEQSRRVSAPPDMRQCCHELVKYSNIWDQTATKQ